MALKMQAGPVVERCVVKTKYPNSEASVSYSEPNLFSKNFYPEDIWFCFFPENAQLNKTQNLILLTPNITSVWLTTGWLWGNLQMCGHYIYAKK